MSVLVSVLLTRGESAEAEATAREALSILQDRGLDRTAQAGALRNDLALSLTYQGRIAEGLPIMRELVALDSALLGPEHPDLAVHLENLGYLYSEAGFTDSNTAVLEQVLAMRRRMLADDDPAIGRTLFNLAAARYLSGEYGAAAPLYAEAHARLERALGPEHGDVVWATASLGRNLWLAGRPGDAERHLRRALEVTDPDGRLQPGDVARIAPHLVALLMSQRRFGEAEPLALRVLAIQDSLADTLARKSALQVAALYEAWGRPERAAEYRRRAGQ